MVRRPWLYPLLLFLLGLFLSGCPKKIPEPVIIEKPPFENPMIKLLDVFSPAESLQARASIRIDTVRDGEKTYYLLNGLLLYQKPDRLRLLGYHPLGMGLFDALYRNGELFLLIPPQKRAYTGEVSQFEDLVEKAGPIEVSSEKSEWDGMPKRIRIEVKEKETEIELRLKEVSVNSSLPEDSFEWVIPNGVEVKSIAQLLRGKKQR